MAMEKLYVIRETHTRGITAVGFNPSRREILMGCEDGCVKTWEAESGRLLQTAFEHRGWVTDFLYWSSAKLVLSSSNDGYIIAWGSGGGIGDKVHIGQPVYCMAINTRRKQLVCGVGGGIKVFLLDENKTCGHVINARTLYFAREHTDIVKCILCNESRIYSAGYDQKLVIYDSSYTGDNSLEPMVINPKAHDAGISCLLLARDNENNTWIFTGSFDKTVKIWSADGKLVHRLDNFLNTVSGICYVPHCKTIWVAGGSSYASLFDPKSGDNVSDFIGTFQQQEEEKYYLQQLRFSPELNILAASTSRRHMVVWKYNSSGCITALRCRTQLESLCYTRKVPILIFSGDNEGAVIKWERMQSNHFMYSKESFVLSDANIKKQKRTGSKARELMLEQQWLEEEKAKGDNLSKSHNKIITSHYTFNKPVIPPVSTHKHPNTTISMILFVESLDYILAASEDSNIYVWGFDDAAVSVLKNMKPQESDCLIRKFAILLDQDSVLLPQNAKTTNGSDSVTNRVAGFVCKYVLSEHTSCVTSLVVVSREHGFDSTYVLSGGWDRRISIWDVENGRLHDVYRKSKTAHNEEQESLELACDGVILDMAYNPKANEFAYASSDKMVYVRKFSTDGSQMKLVNTLQGHEGDVTCVVWNKITNKWVTGSEDSTIRIWCGTGMNECEQILSAQGGVSCMCVDLFNGSIVAGTQNVIRVYDPVEYRLVQTNMGHTDSVRSVIHIPERNQYVSCSWDKTIRVWNAWKRIQRKAGSKSKKQSGTVETVMEEEEEEEFEREEEEEGAEDSS